MEGFKHSSRTRPRFIFYSGSTLTVGIEVPWLCIRSSVPTALPKLYFSLSCLAVQSTYVHLMCFPTYPSFHFCQPLFSYIPILGESSSSSLVQKETPPSSIHSESGAEVDTASLGAVPSHSPIGLPRTLCRFMSHNCCGVDSYN
jgi:hypothetical protein